MITEITETRELWCALSEHDLKERGEQLAQEITGILKLEMERAAINARIKPKKELMEGLAIVIEEKKEKRQVECVWVYEYAKGFKRLYRKDTHDLLDTDTISEFERQRHFQFNGEETPGGFDVDPEEFTETDEKARALTTAEDALS